MSTIPSSAFELPNGQIMDAKNTLQSFDAAINIHVDSAAVRAKNNTNNKKVADSAMLVVAPSDVSIIPSHVQTTAMVNDAIGMVQSYHPPNSTMETHQANSDQARIRGGNSDAFSNTSNSSRNDSANVHAVAVQSLAAADAETFDPLLLHPPPLPPQQLSKACWLALIAAFLLVGIAAGVGGYCASGKCSSEPSNVGSMTSHITEDTPSTMPPAYATMASPVVPVTTNVPMYEAIPSPVVVSNISSSLPTARPVFVSNISSFSPTASPTVVTNFSSSVPTASPVIASNMPSDGSTTTASNASVTVACEFLNYTSLELCLTATSFDGSIFSQGQSIPTEIGLLTKLTLLDLRSSGLTRTIPSSLANLKQLKALQLLLNDLTGTIPSILGSLIQLTSLELRSNDLTGTIPTSLESLTQLTILDLSANGLNGTILSSLDNLVRLKKLYLSNNDLSGTISSSLGNMVALTALSLWGNELTSTIPSSLGELLKLKVLHINSNDLIGTIPTTFGNLSLLQDLRLNNNTQLRGTIPSNLCSLNVRFEVDCDNIVCSCCTDNQGIAC
jgi:Leucine-rich repeat (LRR) protein